MLSKQLSHNAEKSRKGELRINFGPKTIIYAQDLYVGEDDNSTDDEEQEWNVSKRRPLETLLTLSAGASFPVQFYYGTSDENKPVAEIEKLIRKD